MKLRKGRLINLIAIAGIIYLYQKEKKKKALIHDANDIAQEIR